MFVQTKSVILDGTGSGLIELPQVPFGKIWDYVRFNTRISTGATSLGGTVEVYSGQPTPNNYVDGSRTPWGDTATFAEGQASLITPNQMTFRYLNCDPGARATINASYQEGRP